MYLVCRLLLRLPPCSTLFPYTTLFRSLGVDRDGHRHQAAFAARFLPPHARCARLFQGENDVRVIARFTVDQRGNFDHASVSQRGRGIDIDRKSTRLNSSHRCISYAVFCSASPPALHSFPTRRSSDLWAWIVMGTGIRRPSQRVSSRPTPVAPACSKVRTMCASSPVSQSISAVTSTMRPFRSVAAGST